MGNQSGKGMLFLKTERMGFEITREYGALSNAFFYTPLYSTYIKSLKIRYSLYLNDGVTRLHFHTV